MIVAWQASHSTAHSIAYFLFRSVTHVFEAGSGRRLFHSPQRPRARRLQPPPRRPPQRPPLFLISPSQVCLPLTQRSAWILSMAENIYGRRRSVDVGGLALALNDGQSGYGWGGWEDADDGGTRYGMCHSKRTAVSTMTTQICRSSD